MKKLLLTFVALVATTLSFADSKVDFTWSADKDWKTENFVMSRTSGDITISVDKTSTGASTPVINSKAFDLRAYAKAEMTIAASTTMNQIVFHVSAQGLKRLADITASTGDITISADNTTVTWTGLASSVVLTVGDYATHGTDGATKAGQFCVDSPIEITTGTTPGTKPEGGDPDPEPEIVHIANTAETAYTVAQANDIIAAGKALDEKVYVSGTIVSIKEIDTGDYGNATYFISDDGTETGQLEVYRGFDYKGAKFTSADKIKVGDVVVVYGKLVDFKGTYEFTTGSEIYSINGETAPEKEPYTPTGDGSKDKPYTALDIQNIYGTTACPTDFVWVTGIIIGSAKSGSNLQEENVASNIAFGTAEAWIPVELPTTNDIRKALNVVDHPKNIGKEFLVYAKIEKYFSVAGLKGMTEYVDLNPTVVEKKTATVAEAHEATADDLLEVSGSVYATCTSGAVIGDGTGFIYYYNAESTLEIGDAITITGSVVKYNGMNQFTADAEVAKTGTSELDFPEPIEWDAEDLDAWVAAPSVVYVQYEGTMAITSNADNTKTFYNVDVKGAEARGSIVSPTEEMVEDVDDGDTALITGFAMYVSKSNGVSFVNTIATEVEWIPEQAEPADASDLTGTYTIDYCLEEFDPMMGPVINHYKGEITVVGDEDGNVTITGLPTSEEPVKGVYMVQEDDGDIYAGIVCSTETPFSEMYPYVTIEASYGALAFGSGIVSGSAKMTTAFAVKQDNVIPDMFVKYTLVVEVVDRMTGETGSIETCDTYVCMDGEYVDFSNFLGVVWIGAFADGDNIKIPASMDPGEVVYDYTSEDNAVVLEKTDYGYNYVPEYGAMVYGWNVNRIALIAEGKTDGVKAATAATANASAIFNLAGQRLNKAQKGINIINGKKVLK